MSTITIRFKDNKPHRVSGARNEKERADAMRFGEAFVRSLLPAKKPVRCVLVRASGERIDGTEENIHANAADIARGKCRVTYEEG